MNKQIKTASFPIFKHMREYGCNKNWKGSYNLYLH